MKTIVSIFTKSKGLIILPVLTAAILLVAFARRESAGKNRVIWSSRSKSSIEFLGDDGEVQKFVIENHQYLLDLDIVVSQMTKWKVGPWSGNQPSLEATAYKIMPDGKQYKLWAIKEEADEGRLNYSMYHTIWYGCYSAGPNHRLYNLETGNLIMEYGGELLEVWLGNPPEMARYIGYKPAETINTNSWEKDDRYIGTQTYASPDGILHRIAFRGISEDYMDEFGLGFADISLEIGGRNQVSTGPYMGDGIKERLCLERANSSTDARQFTDFRIRLKFFDTSIVIPIVDDDFSIDAQMFKGFEIIRVDPKQERGNRQILGPSTG
jgi:hypothetical protein